MCHEGLPCHTPRHTFSIRHHIPNLTIPRCRQANWKKLTDFIGAAANCEAWIALSIDAAFDEVVRAVNQRRELLKAAMKDIGLANNEFLQQRANEMERDAGCPQPRRRRAAVPRRRSWPALTAASVAVMIEHGVEGSIAAGGSGGMMEARLETVGGMGPGTGCESAGEEAEAK